METGTVRSYACYAIVTQSVSGATETTIFFVFLVILYTEGQLYQYRPKPINCLAVSNVHMTTYTMTNGTVMRCVCMPLELRDLYQQQ